MMAAQILMCLKVRCVNLALAQTGCLTTLGRQIKTELYKRFALESSRVGYYLRGLAEGS